MPLHLSNPEQSVFHIIEAERFNALSTMEVQDIFAKKHILVYGLPDREMEFDEIGLQTLAPPNKTFTIQGKSYRMSEHTMSAHIFIDYTIDVDLDLNIRTREGNTGDLLRAHNSPNGKVLNALDFPLPFTPNPTTAIANNYLAWKRTTNMIGPFQEFPVK